MSKSAIYTILPQESTIDYDGHLSLMMFTAGCNFRCRYCHNPDLIPYTNDTMSIEELRNRLLLAKENWIDAVSISGGEPTMSSFLSETIKEIKSMGFSIKLDTQGSFPDQFEKSLPYIDYVAMDYKAPLKRLSELTQTPIQTDAILTSLEMLKNCGTEYEIRTTVVPGFHTENDMVEICNEIGTVKKYVLQAFVPRDNVPDPAYRTKSRTPLPLLKEYQECCRKYLNNVVVR
ncbi:MAG TPA: anaerobic ribonucleoside-triphosphate reductase activating protein [Caldisericia bacterium]|nr:anaerobic ribonucleoside-triphosphate reductase activating protein [Caldisericia bacterium]